MTEASKVDGKLQEKEADALLEKRSPAPLIVRGVSGKVSWYSVNKGFGFIQRDDGEPDVFVHSSAIVRNSRHARILSENEKVEFDVINGRKGPEAAVVTGKGGKVVIGYTFMFSGKLRVNRGRAHERQFKRRHGQASDAKESENKGTSSNESSGSGEDNVGLSENGGSNRNIDEKGDDKNLHKSSEVKKDSKPEAEQPTSKQPTKSETTKKAKETQLKQEPKEEQQASQQSTKSESSKNSKTANLKKDHKPKAEQADGKQTSKNEPSKSDKQVQPKQDSKPKADKQALKQPVKTEPAESK